MEGWHILVLDYTYIGGGNLVVITLNSNFWLSTDLEKGCFPNSTFFTLRHLASFSTPASWW